MSDALFVAQEAWKSKDYPAVLKNVATAIAEDPGRFEPWVLRGAVQLIKKDYYSAILNNDKALEIEPNLFQALNNRAASYCALNMLDEAITDLNRAIELHPPGWEPHLQLGLLYASTERLDAAEYHFREALKRSDTYALHLALGTLLLGTGNWPEGHIHDNARPEIAYQPFPAPWWKGEDLNGKHILLFSEGGQGDRLQSFRYIGSVRKAYPKAKITLKIPKQFTRIIANSFDEEQTLNTVKTDYVCSLTNVPYVMGMTWDTIPRPDGYLNALPNKKFEDKIKALPPGINIGLCWASNNGNAKILPVSCIEEIGSMPGVNFISLMVPRLRELKANFTIHDWVDDINDWADTASIVNALDVVISIDSAVAHLAGALGKQVSCLVRYSVYWPWMASFVPPSPRYSVLYPSMTLFRQQIMGDWAIPVSRLIVELQRQFIGLTKAS